MRIYIIVFAIVLLITGAWMFSHFSHTETFVLNAPKQISTTANTTSTPISTTQTNLSIPPQTSTSTSSAKNTPLPSSQNTIAYSSYNVGKVVFEYPSSWNTPSMIQRSTRVIGKFSNNTTFESGIYYNQNTGKNNTVQDLVNAYAGYSAVKNLNISALTINGNSVTKVTYTGAEGSKLMIAYLAVDKNGQIFTISATEDKVTPAEFERLIGSLKIVK